MTRTIPYRRKREGRTDYAKRLHLLKSKRARVVLRCTNTQLIAQLVTFSPQGDVVLVGVDSSSLRKKGWTYSHKNLPAAYLTGLLFGKTALQNGIEEGILDTGFLSPLKKGKVFAFLKGLLDSGFSVPVGGDDIFPADERLSGKHIKDYAATLDGKTAQFGKYLKNKSLPETIEAQFILVKKQLLEHNNGTKK